MGKLVKAEIFRMKRINSFWIFSLFLWLTALAIPFINHADSAITYFNGSLVSDGAVMFMMIALSAAFFTGRGYYHRTSMYEVMAGNSPIRIILSKILSIALPITLIIFIPHLIGLGTAVFSGVSARQHVRRTSHDDRKEYGRDGARVCPAPY